MRNTSPCELCVVCAGCGVAAQWGVVCAAHADREAAVCISAALCVRMSRRWRQQQQKLLLTRTCQREQPQQMRSTPRLTSPSLGSRGMGGAQGELKGS